MTCFTALGELERRGFPKLASPSFHVFCLTSSLEPCPMGKLFITSLSSFSVHTRLTASAFLLDPQFLLKPQSHHMSIVFFLLVNKWGEQSHTWYRYSFFFPMRVKTCEKRCSVKDLLKMMAKSGENMPSKVKIILKMCGQGLSYFYLYLPLYVKRWFKEKTVYCKMT